MNIGLDPQFSRKLLGGSNIGADDQENRLEMWSILQKIGKCI